MKLVRSFSLAFVLIALVALLTPRFMLAQDPQPTQPVVEEVDSEAIPLLIDGSPYAFPVVTYERGQNTPQADQALSVSVWYGLNQSFGQLGQPQTWANILGEVVDATPATTLEYRLNGGPPSALSIGPDLRRLYDDGSFNIEINYNDLLPGANTVAITAKTGATQDTENVIVNYTPGVSLPLNYDIDWSTAGDIQDVAHVVDGLWEISGGELRTVTPGYDRLVNIGDLSWTDYEITVPITVESLNTAEWGAPSFGAGVGFITGWQGHYLQDVEQPGIGWRRALGSLTWFKWDPNGNAGFEMRGHGGQDLAYRSDLQIDLNQTYWFKMSVQKNSLEGLPATYRFKYWPAGDPEPAVWTLQSEGVAGEPPVARCYW